MFANSYYFKCLKISISTVLSNVIILKFVDCLGLSMNKLYSCAYNQTEVRGGVRLKVQTFSFSTIILQISFYSLLRSDFLRN